LIPDGFPVFLYLTKIPGWDAEDQHIVLFHQRDRVIFQVMQRHQFRANDVANFLCRHFGVAGAGTIEQTNIHRVTISILALTLRVVYQKPVAIRHNGLTAESKGLMWKRISH
jgi:hypothetical protein